MFTMTRTALIAASLLALPVLQACESTPPTINDVVTDPQGVRTGYIADTPDGSWRFFDHNDELDTAWCADLVIAPDGKLRFLAFLHEIPGDNWLLSIRTGLGPATWSETFSAVAIPAITDPEGGPPNPCQSLRIVHLKDDLYGIVWITNGELHNAVYDGSKSPPADLKLGPVTPFPAFEGINARRASMAFLDNEVNLVWSPANRERIYTMTGTLTDSGIDFGPFATFAPIAHDQLSDVIAHEGVLYVATRDEEVMRLYATATGGTNWTEMDSCETGPGWRIEGTLLFAEADDDIWLAESLNQFDNRLQNFEDCSTRPLEMPITNGKLTYHPGD